MIESIIDRVTRLSIRFRWITIALTVLVMAAGIWAATQLNQELLPQIEFPQSVILALNPGAETDVMLEEVTIPLEEALGGVDGVVNIESTTSPGASILIIRNEFGIDIEAVREEMRQEMAAIDYPGDMEAPELLTFSFSDLPVASISVSSDNLSLAELKELVESEISPELLALEGVAEVQVSGGQELPEEQVAEAEEEATPEPTPTDTPEPTATATAEPTATTEPTATATEEPTATAETAATPEPVALPQSWITAAAAQGAELETTADLTAEVVAGIAGFAPEMLAELTPEMLLAMPPEALSALPQAYLAGLDPELQAQLAAAATPEAAATPAVTATITATATTVEDVPLPDSWVAAAAAQGVEIETTADVTPELMGGIVELAPELLAALEPPMWRALEPAVLEGALPQVEETLDPTLAAQLRAIWVAGTEAEAEPLPLPETWTEGAAQMGMTLETTADLTPELLEGILQFAPEMLQTLTPEMVLALSPEAQATLPPAFVATLDDGVQETLAIAGTRWQQYRAATGELAGEAGEGEAEATPAATPDPAQLPAVITSAASNFEMTLETAGDLTPEIMRQLTSVPQGAQMLQLLSDDNLRLLPPESIALLPPEFVATLDPELRAELDERAEAYGGAGVLAEQEAAEREAAEASAGEAPPLPEPWSTPDETGNVFFENAGDILFNDFGLTAAELINQIPSSPNVQDPALWMSSLTPEIMAFLAENEEGFVDNLSLPILELMSPETLTFLLENYPDQFEPAQAERLQAVAAGEVEVFVPEATITRLNRQPSLNLNIYKDNEANTVAVSERVFERLDELAAAHEGFGYNVAFEQASFIEESVNGVAREGALGAVFAIVVILIFLSGRTGQGNFVWSWRSTLVTAVSIPLSVFMAFALLRWLGPALSPVLDPLVSATADTPLLGSIFLALRRLFPENATLNIMTLSGMTVAIGRVVDDSIVVLENIYRHIQRGENQLESVLVGTRDVAIAILASTVTTVIVFLPIGLTGGIIGEFFLPFGVTVTYALMSSFLVAVTIVPLLAFLFIRAEHLPPEGETALQRQYTPILRWALDHRLITLIIATILFGGSMWLLNERPQAFLPELGEVRITTSVDLPDDYTIVETNEQVLAFEEAIDDIEGLGATVVEVGSGGGLEQQFLGGAINQSAASLQIAIEDAGNVNAITQAVREEAEAVFGEESVRVSSGTLSSQGFGGFALVLSGEREDLAGVNDAVLAELAAVDGLANPSSNLADEDTILRVDGEPAVRYTGELETEDSLGVTEAAKDRVQEVVPAQIEVSEGFETQQQTEGFAQALEAIGISIIIVYLVMVITFHSFVHPFTILFSLPLAVIGAAVALWLTNRVLGLSALVGLMMLVGIVVTNAIVLIDRVQANRKKRGMTVREALVEGGQTRLRPILMTAIAAMMALLPLAAGFSEGAIVAEELGTVVIGGLFSSTLLTLLVVPVMYSLLDRLARQKEETE